MGFKGEQEDETHREFLDRKSMHMKEWYKDHKKEVKIRRAKYYKDHKKEASDRHNIKRLKAMNILGEPICIRCGFSDVRALTFDHINNDGCLEKKHENGNRDIHVEDWIIANSEEARKKYQILCANCNWIKHVEFCEVKRNGL